MVKLERTMSAGIPAERCLTFEEIERFVADGSLGERLITTDQAIDYMPEHIVAEAKVTAALQGKAPVAEYDFTTCDGQPAFPFV